MPNDFTEHSRYGKLGEDFVNYYSNLLQRDQTFVVSALKKGPEGADAVTVTFDQEVHDLRQMKRETKTYGGLSILKFGERYPNPNRPTIPFDLFKTPSYTDYNRRMDRKQWKKGWLYAITHPDDTLVGSRPDRAFVPRTVRPDSLAYLFCRAPQSESIEKIDPFVAIIFEDFALLEERLVQLMGEQLGLDLVVWNLPAATDGFWGRAEIKKFVPFNEWNVPLELVKDLATITMIDDDPDLSQAFSDEEIFMYGKLYRGRLEYLKELAGERERLDTGKFPMREGQRPFDVEQFLSN